MLNRKSFRMPATEGDKCQDPPLSHGSGSKPTFCDLGMLGPGLEDCIQRPRKKPHSRKEDPLCSCPHTYQSGLRCWCPNGCPSWHSQARWTVPDSGASKAPAYSPGGERILSSHNVNRSTVPSTNGAERGFDYGPPHEKQPFVPHHVRLCLSLPIVLGHNRVAIRTVTPTGGGFC